MPVTTRPRLLSSAVAGFFYAPAVKIKYQFEIAIDGKLYPEHGLIPDVPWAKLRVGDNILFPNKGCMDVAIVTEVHARFGDDRTEILTRIVADSNF